MKIKVCDEWKEYPVSLEEENDYGGYPISAPSPQMLSDLTYEVGYNIVGAYGVYVPGSKTQCVIAISDEDWMDTRYGENEFALEAQYTPEEVLHMTGHL